MSGIIRWLYAFPVHVDRDADIALRRKIFGDGALVLAEPRPLMGDKNARPPSRNGCVPCHVALVGPVAFSVLAQLRVHRTIVIVARAREPIGDDPKRSRTSP
jgi:hypothetical protein